jgi:predicted amidophosphoribosyltransferase
MTTYADPTRCPDCGAVLPHEPQVCQSCALPLTGETAISLFRTLQQADRLLGALRAQKQPVPVAAVRTTYAGARFDGVESYAP